MGCSSIKEKLENEIIKLEIKKIEIQMEKYNQLQKLAKIENHEIRPNIIPDHIEPELSKEHKINIENSNDKKSAKLEKAILKKEKKVSIIKKRNSRKSKVKIN